MGRGDAATRCLTSASWLAAHPLGLISPSNLREKKKRRVSREAEGQAADASVSARRRTLTHAGPKTSDLKAASPGRPKTHKCSKKKSQLGRTSAGFWVEPLSCASKGSEKNPPRLQNIAAPPGNHLREASVILSRSPGSFWRRTCTVAQLH